MIIKIIHNNENYKLDTNNSIDISIPYQFNNKQPNFFDVNPGVSSPLILNNNIYSVQSGASCNVSEIKMNIHCTGTHTECVGHILKDPGDIGTMLNDIILPSLLISVEPKPFELTKDLYHCSVKKNELVISKKIIEDAVKNINQYCPEALIIRSIPNPLEKKSYQYQSNVPPFFTNDALKYIADLKIRHLVVDLPSIDRMHDKGLLGNHRIFWNNNSQPFEEVNSKSKNTITEMSYIPNQINDGFYFLNIQIPHFVNDAAPSRPLIFKPL